ncbi:hypothetical protein TWF679_002680 [Orbilia oligospora]|uniref:Heat shock factor binding protein 1 n=1 Tax=Orbilia oligospora TaxID=2813651 RepID=A0A8H8VG01_ORBOL|nr:hypothetical protein TWF679_002680 [Orbilia oligospora]
MSNPQTSATSLMNGQATPGSRAPSSHPQSVDEVIADINGAIDKLTDKFTTASKEFFGRLDEISTRLDVLEQSILASHTNESGGTAVTTANGNNVEAELGGVLEKKEPTGSDTATTSAAPANAEFKE